MMDNLPLLIDVLIMLSVLGSAAAGIMCGWQLCSDNFAKSGHVKVDDGSIADPIVLSEATDGDDEVLQLIRDPLPMRSKQPIAAAESASATPAAHSSRPEAGGEAVPESVSPVFIGVAERLLDMADRITNDVNAHDAQLTEVNTSLSGGSAVLSMESVIAAVEKLVKANQLMQSQLSESRDRIVEQAHEIEKAELHAHTDALTRIGNRRAFDRELSEWSGETPGVLCLIDIDHFKRFNDDHGHRVGDEVLKSVALALRDHLEGHCLVARYGGEEFGLIFSNHILEDVLELIETARRSISQHTTTFEGKTFKITCSLGITRMLAGEPSTEWMQRADEALYISKDAGRDCSHCLDSIVLGKRQPPYKVVIHDGRVTRQECLSDQLPPEKTAKPTADSDAASLARRTAIKEALLCIPDREALRKLYAELIQRLGKSPVKLSVIALSVAEPELKVDPSSTDDLGSRFLKLLDVTKSFCRAVDRVGYLDGSTLLICMPGLEGAQAAGRLSQLKALAATQLNLNADVLRLGLTSAVVGDSFDNLVDRAAAARI